MARQRRKARAAEPANDWTAEREAVVREIYARWLSDGQSWIGVFENHDLGHPLVGHRVSFQFDLAQLTSAVIGQTRGPDHKEYGLGWRYLLIAKALTVDEAVAWLKHEEVRA